jgi:hypothetical protein
MKLIDLVPYLVNRERLNQLYDKRKADINSDILLIYMVDIIDIESDVVIFDIKETDDLLFFNKDGVEYVQLFTVDHTADLIEYDLELKDQGYSDLQIAERLVSYRINDA